MRRNERQEDGNQDKRPHDNLEDWGGLAQLEVEPKWLELEVRFLDVKPSERPQRWHGRSGSRSCWGRGLEGEGKAYAKGSKIFSEYNQGCRKGKATHKAPPRKGEVRSETAWRKEATGSYYFFGFGEL